MNKGTDTTNPKAAALGGSEPAPATTCNVPSCETEKIFSRGLCSTHYWRLRRPDREGHGEAKRYASPPKRKPTAKKKPATAPPPKPCSEPAEEMMPMSEHRDDVIATCCDLASALGLKMLRGRGTRHFFDPDTDSGRVAELTDEGLVYEAQLTRKH